MKIFLIAVAACCSTALAQPSAAPTFPDGAASPNAGELRERLAGKLIKVQLADGSSWRLEYKANGYFYVNTSGGFSDTGEWRTEDGKLCSKGRKITSNCNEVRVVGDALYLKRDSGEIIQFVTAQ